MKENGHFRVRYSYTMNWRKWASKQIARATGSLWSHISIVFYIGDTAPVYFESIWKTQNRGDGVRGPIAYQRELDWAAEDPDYRRVELQPLDGFLPLSFEEAEAMYRFYCAAVAEGIGYAKLQLGQNLFTSLTGLHIHRGRGSYDRWTCSETAVRGLGVAPEVLLKYFDYHNCRADDFAPAGNKLVSVYECVEKWIAEKGTISLPGGTNNE